ncbi:NADP-dependent oxidoreductase [Candidatus Gottesmanbacteria bacterium]|nr:NADP-dependent oxidoreductase [Candidatus Gottesmanbacteria bacterium]
MKAIQIHGYGSSEVLEINNNAPTPSVGKNQVLVEGRAASINPFDLGIVAGYFKDKIPLTFPVTVGGDFSGVVSEIGEGVLQVKVGDEIYGSANTLGGGSGSFAELIVANVANVVHKPKNTNFQEAAALPLAGASAVQGLEEHIHLQPGQKICIHGGAGGIGHLAIQLAKSIGAHVATTVRTEDLSFAKQLGADEVIDYKTQAFETMLKEYNAVFVMAMGDVVQKSFAILKRGGILVSMVGQPDSTLAQTHGVTAIGQGTKTNTQHLARVAELVESGKIKVNVDTVFPLVQIKEAWEYKQTGHPKGKIVVSIQ